MTQPEQNRRKPLKNESPGGLSLWFQRKMNARMNRKIRRGRGAVMGMELLPGTS